MDCLKVFTGFLGFESCQKALPAICFMRIVIYGRLTSGYIRFMRRGSEDCAFKPHGGLEECRCKSGGWEATVGIVTYQSAFEHKPRPQHPSPQNPKPPTSRKLTPSAL